MRTFSKLLTVIAFAVITVSCKNDLEKAAAEKTGSVKKTVVHDGSRTLTITDVPAGTTTLSGTHDIIRIANGANLKLSAASQWNSFDWSLYSTSGTPVYITIESGAAVHSFGPNTIPVGVTVYNKGELQNHNNDFLVQGNFSNQGKHYITYSLKLSNGATYGHSALLGAQVLEAYKLISDQGALNLRYTTATFHDIQVTPPTGGAFTGDGKVNIYQGDVLFGRLCSSASIKVCMTGGVLNYYGGGYFGGTASCL